MCLLSEASILRVQKAEGVSAPYLQVGEREFHTPSMRVEGAPMLFALRLIRPIHDMQYSQRSAPLARCRVGVSVWVSDDGSQFM